MYVQYPLGGDQGILLWVGDVIRGGGVPYRDSFEIRGPAFDYIHALILAVFGRNAWGIRVFDLLILALGGWLVWRIGFHAAGRTAATAGAVLFLLWYAAVDYWSTAQSDGWSAVILAGVVALLLPTDRRLSWLRAGFAGALVALCTLNKPTFAIFGLLPAIRALIEPDRRMPRVSALWLTAAVGFAVPILICVAWFAAHAALDDLIEVHILWTLSQYSGLDQPWLTRVQTAIAWFLTSKFAVALGVAVGGLAFLSRTRRADAILIGTWLALAIFNVIAQGRYWEYQWLVIYPVLGVLGGIGVYALLQMRAGLVAGAASTPPTTIPATRAIPSAILAVLFIAALFTPSRDVYRWVKVQLRLTNAHEYDRMMYGPYGPRSPQSFVGIADYIKTRTSDRDEVLVWGTVQGINFLSGRRSPTRFAYLKAFKTEGDERFRPKYLREFLGVMQKKPPTYIVALDERFCDVVVQSGLMSHDHIAYPMSCLSDLPELQQIVGQRYSLERNFGGYLVFRLRA